MQSVVRQWLGQQPALFFASGIQKLFNRWDKCLNELGQYVNKKAQLTQREARDSLGI